MSLMMNRFRYFAAFLLTGILLISCQRDEIKDEDRDLDTIMTAMDDQVLILDTNQLTGPQRSYGLVSFALNGMAPSLPKGTCFLYPGSPGVYGRIVSTANQEDSLQIQFETVGVEYLFTALNQITKISSQEPAEITILPGSAWDEDTLKLFKYTLFSGMINDNPLMVSFQDGKLYAGEQLDHSVLVHRASDIPLRRYLMDYSYEQEFNGVARITSFGSVDGKDSIRISSRLFGPFFAGPMPIFYQVDHFLGFEVHLAKDTVAILDFKIYEKGSVKTTYNFWGDWKINHQIEENQVSFDTVISPRLSNHLIHIFFARAITPLFAGEPSHQFVQESGAELKNFINLPEWQREKRIYSTASAIKVGNALSDIWPEILAAEEDTLYRDLQNGIHNNTHPVASFRINPPGGSTTTNFEFDASASTDFETSTENLQVRWDFDGDNHYDTEFTTSKTIYRVFPVPGIYQVVLEVRDEGGLTSRSTQSLTVELTHSAPTAFFTVTPESGRTTSFFTFDATGSWDADDPAELLKVRWDFDGDGIWDTQFNTNKFAVWIYPEAGEYVAKLEVKDTEGLTGSTSKMILVSPANIKPTAFFTVTPESGTVETIFQFDASGSSDPEDSIDQLQVRWDWNNDGVWDIGYRYEKTITKAFEVAGEYRVVLEVTDTEGFANTYSRVITVSNPNTPPTADFTITPPVGTTDTQFQFDASISRDLEDSLEELEVRWDWDNDDVWDTDFTTLKTASYSFTQPGSYIIKLQVKDSGGLTSQKARLVIVE
ncbi:MAG: PKD domain-containing protein [Bacteroidales bacterium]|nr:PKD domain-containing protein [Bacteroidales bacterium]MDD2812911.1 PKD domain-containing protein [Bacteroidales bacterium]MDD3871556.1 PKD domain-containing protein [Bacteroidales bacterium]